MVMLCLIAIIKHSITLYRFYYLDNGQKEPGLYGRFVNGD